MKAAVLSKSGELRVVEMPEPRIRKGEMLVRTQACGLCGSDLFKIRNRSVPPGTVLGHEVVAVVEQCPPSYRGLFPPGTRVTISNHIPCGRCDPCRRGRISMCPQFQGTSMDPGGFAEFIRVPETHLPEGVIPLPEHLSDEEAVMVEPLACCLRALERWGPEKGERVWIVGLGPIGLLMALLLRWVGAEPYGVDPIPKRRETAYRMGCTGVRTPEEAQEEGPTRGVVITVCNASSLKTGFRLVRPGGWIGLFAGPSRDVPLPLDLHRLYKGEIDLLPSYSTGPEHMKRARDLLCSGQIRTTGLISHTLPIEEIQKAVHMAERREGLKALLRF